MCDFSRWAYACPVPCFSSISPGVSMLSGDLGAKPSGTNFNASGASPDGSHGEDHDPESHLIPIVCAAAAGQRESIRVFGTDYDTPDGTCIRDYVHVDDLAAAHELALEACTEGRARIYNVGAGRGHPVLEVIESVERASGERVRREEAPRRAGDVARLVACPERLERELDWRPAWTDLDALVASAWEWHHSHPEGYGD